MPKHATIVLRRGGGGTNREEIAGPFLIKHVSIGGELEYFDATTAAGAGLKLAPTMIDFFGPAGARVVVPRGRVAEFVVSGIEDL